MIEVPRTEWARTIDGATVAYQDFGDGDPPLLVIHGWVSHLEIYWEQPRYVRFMQRLARRFRVLTFDKRGVGMSDRFPVAPDLETRMDDVGAVLAAAGVDRATILAWGAGGPPLAAMFAASHPDQTLALCIDPAILEHRTPDFPYGDDALHGELSREWLSSWGHFAEIPGFDTTPHDTDLISWANRLLRFAATPTSYECVYRSWYEQDVRDVLSSIRVPTLVLAKAGSAWANADAAANVAARIPGARVSVIEGREGVVWMEDPEPFVSAVESFVEDVRGEEAEMDRVLVTVLFTDIVESTATAASMGDTKWHALLAEHDRLAKAIVARYHGDYLKSIGDGMMASFDGPGRAVRCAKALAECVSSLGIEIRSGVHTGEVTKRDGDLFGLGVNVAARVVSLAGPSQVWVSSTVKDLVAGSGLLFEDAGEHELKGVPDRWRLYRLKA